MFKILLATKNKGKIKEIKGIFADLSVKLIELPANDTDEVEEDGKSYFENALKKAKHYALKYHLPTLADDSGLEIDALDGAPGINSARFVSKEATFNEKILKILELMQDVDKRSARFRATFVLYLPKEDKYFTSVGVVEGEILSKPQKKEGSGFGYDPIFKPEGFDESFSMLGTDIKNRISHRSKALNEMKKIIAKQFLGGSKMVEIKVNGRRLPANKYVYKVFESVILALLDTLKDIPEIKKVEIIIDKEKEDKSTLSL
jgi:XTP/dITP diphosphohydrolase